MKIKWRSLEFHHIPSYPRLQASSYGQLVVITYSYETVLLEEQVLYLNHRVIKVRVFILGLVFFYCSQLKERYCIISSAFIIVPVVPTDLITWIIYTHINSKISYSNYNIWASSLEDRKLEHPVYYIAC